MMISPPLTSSTKGKETKSNARATSSSTVEKRWNLRRRGTGFSDSVPLRSFVRFTPHNCLLPQAREKNLNVLERSPFGLTEIRFVT